MKMKKQQLVQAIKGSNKAIIKRDVYGGYRDLRREDLMKMDDKDYNVTITPHEIIVDWGH